MEVSNSVTISQMSSTNKLVGKLLDEGKVSESLALLDEQVEKLEALPITKNEKLRYFIGESNDLREKIREQGSTPTVRKRVHHVEYVIEKSDYGYMSGYSMSSTYVSPKVDNSKNENNHPEKKHKESKSKDKKSKDKKTKKGGYVPSNETSGYVLQNEGGSINYEQPDIEINREPLNQSRDKLDHSSGYIGYNENSNQNYESVENITIPEKKENNQKEEENKEPLNQSRDKLDHSSGYIGYNQVVNPNNDHDKTDKTDTTGYLDYTSNEIENSNEKISKSKDKLEHSSGYIGYNSES